MGVAAVTTYKTWMGFVLIFWVEAVIREQQQKQQQKKEKMTISCVLPGVGDITQPWLSGALKAPSC